MRDETSTINLDGAGINVETKLDFSHNGRYMKCYISVQASSEQCFKCVTDNFLLKVIDVMQSVTAEKADVNEG